MIDVRNLSKAYGSVQALEDVTFTITDGEIVGLLGPNGAGKTTIIKTMTGYLQPDEGLVKIDGLDVLTETMAAQERIGYLPENAPLYPELTVLEYLEMMAELRRIPLDQVSSKLVEAIQATGLKPRLNQPIGELSRGYRQRVGLAQAILHKPRFLILDEPTVGLDPTQIVEMRGLIRRLAQDSTILFSTHILSEVEALCDRVIMLFNGRVRLDSSLAALAQTNDALLELDDRVSGVRKHLLQLPGVNGVDELGSENDHPVYRISGDADVDLFPPIFRLAADQSWPVRGLRPDAQTLETIFNQMAVSE